MKNFITGWPNLQCPYCDEPMAVTATKHISFIDTHTSDGKMIKKATLINEDEDWNKESHPYMILKCECLSCDRISYAKLKMEIDIKDTKVGMSFQYKTEY